MAAISSRKVDPIYPSLSAFKDHPSTVVLSSDEESKPTNSIKKMKKNVSSIKRTVESCVSLNEFEDSFLMNHHQHKQSPSSVHWGYARSVLQFMYTWKIVVLGLFLALIVISVVDEGTGRDNYLLCSQSTDRSSMPCIDDQSKEVATVTAIQFRNVIHSRAGEFDCGGKTERRGLTFMELQQFSKEEWGLELSNTEIKNVLYLFLFNKHWGIRVYGEDAVTLITESQYEDINELCSVESTRPHKAFSCYIKHGVSFVWQKIRQVLMSSFIIILIVMFISYYVKRKKMEEAAVFIMVDRITKLLSEHYRKSQKDKDLLPYLAITHVRDALILPSERHKNQVIWDKSVKWIAKKESRVRVETRRIAGEDLLVWRWIDHSDPLPTDEPDNVWPGKALEDYPPGLESKMAPPVGSPSICVRIKNMFEPMRKVNPTDVKGIRNAVIKKCSSIGHIVHIYVDKKSSHGCVYFKMDSLENAIKAYKTFHGIWFGRRLVTAKYIPESKYYKWFPIAISAKIPLTIDS